MQRDYKEHSSVLMPKTYMAAALAHYLPTQPLKRCDQLRPGDNGQTLAHAETASLRRTTPESIERPSSYSPST
jgi:hypothetical protein